MSFGIGIIEPSGYNVLVRSLLGLALLVIGPASAHESIETRNHRAVSLAFLRVPTRTAVADEGRSLFGARLVVGNDFRRRGIVDEDYEVTRLQLDWACGLPGERELWIELPLIDRGGGFLDAIIDAWHEFVLGWSDPSRDMTRFGRSVVKLRDRYEFGPRAGIGDLSAGLAGKAGRWTWRGGLKLPTGEASALLGSGGIDLGLGVSRSLTLGPTWTLAAAGAIVYQSPSPSIPDVRPLADQQTFALIWSPARGQAWVAQWQSESSPTRDQRPGVSAPHRLVTFAHRQTVGNRTLELYFSEDRDLFNGSIPELANVGPDFMIGIALIWRR